MNTPPKFSVIIPNYNNAETLERAILSALNQSYPAHEIIVIDDGSTDNSKNILERFGTQITCIFQENRGVSAARNRAAAVATGDWLAFLDADDTYNVDRLSAHADWIKEEPDLDFLLAEQESRLPNGEFVQFFMKSSKFGDTLLNMHKGESRIALTPSMFGDLIADGFTEIRTLSVPREKFIKLGGFPLDHKIGEDLHFFIRLFIKSNKGGVVPLSLATYYIYEKSTLRQDALKTMRLFNETLSSLDNVIQCAPLHIRRGFLLKRREIRLNLAYALLRAGLKRDAILTVAPQILKRPGIQTLRDFFSICRGIR